MRSKTLNSSRDLSIRLSKQSSCTLVPWKMIIITMWLSVPMQTQVGQLVFGKMVGCSKSLKVLILIVLSFAQTLTILFAPAMTSRGTLLEPRPKKKFRKKSPRGMVIQVLKVLPQSMNSVETVTSNQVVVLPKSTEARLSLVGPTPSTTPILPRQQQVLTRSFLHPRLSETLDHVISVHGTAKVFQGYLAVLKSNTVFETKMYMARRYNVGLNHTQMAS